MPHTGLMIDGDEGSGGRSRVVPLTEWREPFLGWPRKPEVRGQVEGGRREGLDCCINRMQSMGSVLALILLSAAGRDHAVLARIKITWRLGPGR